LHQVLQNTEYFAIATRDINLLDGLAQGTTPAVRRAWCLALLAGALDRGGKANEEIIEKTG
jgi:hypothetical protein